MPLPTIFSSLSPLVSFRTSQLSRLKELQLPLCTWPKRCLGSEVNKQTQLWGSYVMWFIQLTFRNSYLAFTNSLLNMTNWGFICVVVLLSLYSETQGLTHSRFQVIFLPRRSSVHCYWGLLMSVSWLVVCLANYSYVMQEQPLHFLNDVHSYQIIFVVHVFIVMAKTVHNG